MREWPEIELTPEQEEETAAIEDILRAKAQVTAKYMARLMASKGNPHLFGETEFLLRDAVHRLVTEGIDIALHERNSVRCSLSRNGVSREPHRLSRLWKRHPVRDLSSVRCDVLDGRGALRAAC